MMRRRRGALGECEARTQGALVFENTGATEDAESRRPGRPGEEAERRVREELGLRYLWSSDEDVGLAAEIGVVVDPGGAGQAALDERYGPGMVLLFPALTPVAG